MAVGMPMCGWSILERPPFFLMGRHWITGSPGKKATGRMGTCWDWTIWLASWEASLKDELRKAQNLQGFSVTFCFTEVEGNSVRRKPLTPSSWDFQCRRSCIQNPAVSDQSYFASALYEPKWIIPDWSVLHQMNLRLVLREWRSPYSGITPAWVKRSVW